MEYLRWILLLLGLIVLVAVYLLGRKRNTARSADDYADYEYDESELFVPDGESDLVFDSKSPSPQPDISEDDARSHVLSNLSHELETLNYLLGRKERQPEVEPAELEPELAEEPIVSPPEFVDPIMPNEPMLGDLFGETTEEAGPQITAQEQPEKIITLHISARGDDHIQGSDLLRVFEARGYGFGEMDIYHSRHEGVTVFSLVNMVEPGWFDPSSMDGFSTPGISLFLQLPGPLAGDVAFDVLVSEARELARELNAMVLDASRSTLTMQMEQHLREEVSQYDFQRKRERRD